MLVCRELKDLTDETQEQDRWSPIKLPTSDRSPRRRWRGANIGSGAAKVPSGTILGL